MRLTLLAALSLAALGAAACCSVDSIRTDALPDGTVGQFYTFLLEHNCSGSSTSDVPRWAMNGEMPPGLRFSDDGRLSGTPTAAGSYTLEASLMVYRGFGGAVPRTTRSFVLVIHPPTGRLSGSEP